MFLTYSAEMKMTQEQSDEFLSIIKNYRVEFLSLLLLSILSTKYSNCSFHEISDFNVSDCF